MDIQKFGKLSRWVVLSFTSFGLLGGLGISKSQTQKINKVYSHSTSTFSSKSSLLKHKFLEISNSKDFSEAYMWFLYFWFYKLMKANSSIYFPSFEKAFKHFHNIDWARVKSLLALDDIEVDGLVLQDSKIKDEFIENILGSLDKDGKALKLRREYLVEQGKVFDKNREALREKWAQAKRSWAKYRD